MRHKLGITTKIGLLAVSLVMLTGISVAALFFKGTNSILVRHELQSLEEELPLRAVQINSTIQTLREDVRFLSLTPPVQGIIRAREGNGFDTLGNSSESQWKKRLNIIFSEFLRAKPQYLQLRYIGVAEKGREIVRVENGGGSIREIGEGGLQQKGDTRYFQETIKLKPEKIYLSEIELNRERGIVVEPHLPVLRAAVPVYTPGLDLFGIVIINMDFGRTMKELGFERHNNYLTNGKGDYLLHHDSSRAFGFDLGRRFTIQGTYPELQKLFLPSHNLKKTTVISKDKNVNVIHFLKVFIDPNQPQRFLGLAQTTPYGKVTEESTAIFQQGAFLTLLAISISIVLAFFFSRILVRPLLQITNAAKEVAEGNLDIKLSVKSRDEIGLLAKAFETMAKELRQRNDDLKKANLELEQRVEDRTKELKESETRVKAVVDNAADGIITIDEKGTIGSFNNAAEDIFGFKFDEVAAKNIKMLMPDPYHSNHDLYLENYLRTGEKKVVGITREVEGLRKNGSTFPIDLAVSEIWLGGKRMFTGICRDITNRKKAEEEIHNSRKAAEVTAEELKTTLQVSEELRNEAEASERQAEKYAQKAEDANRAKSEFLARMSHEIRTPMNAILGTAELLNETSLTAEQKKFIQIFQGAGETLLHLINDILDLSKVESGQIELEHTDFKVRGILEETVGMMSARAREKGIDLLYHFREDVPEMLVGDPARLRQVFINLLGNAIKFTEKGEVALECRVLNSKCERRKTENRGQRTEDREPNVEDGVLKPVTNNPQLAMLCFSVKDTGLGILKDKQATIFEAFAQADSSTTRKFGGTGLGLAISRRLVELMGGQLCLDSEPGKGSTFYFCVSLDVSSLPVPKAPPKSTEPIKSVALKELPPLHILLVEDTKDNRMLVLAFLKKTPCTVEVAENGKIAVDKFKAGKFDFVLMDMQMPVMDGYTATRQIRQWEEEMRRKAENEGRGTKEGFKSSIDNHQSSFRTPIVALTAHALKEDEQKSLDAGCDAHITKPIKKKKLLETILQFCKK